MRRCGKEELHEPHSWDEYRSHYDCDGRTTNEGMVGQLTVRELREALEGEQDNALVIVGGEGVGRVLAVPALDRVKGLPTVKFSYWMERTYTCPKCGMTSYNPNDVREGYCGNCHDWTRSRVSE